MEFLGFWKKSHIINLPLQVKLQSKFETPQAMRWSRMLLPLWTHAVYGPLNRRKWTYNYFLYPCSRYTIKIIRRKCLQKTQSYTMQYNN